MTFGSVSIVVIAVCNVVWLLSVIIALGLLRALTRRDRSQVTFAPANPSEYSEAAPASPARQQFPGAHRSMLAGFPAGLGRFFQSTSVDQAPTVVPSEPARE
jgi:hypothetical protein